MTIVWELLTTKVEVIVILEENTQRKSAEALAIKRLRQLDDPSQLITVIEADQEIDEDELREWVLNHEKEHNYIPKI